MNSFVLLALVASSLEVDGNLKGAALAETADEIEEDAEFESAGWAQRTTHE